METVVKELVLSGVTDANQLTGGDLCERRFNCWNQGLHICVPICPGDHQNDCKIDGCPILFVLNAAIHRYERIKLCGSQLEQCAILFALPPSPSHSHYMELWGKVMTKAMIQLFVKQHAHEPPWKKQPETQIREMLQLADG